MGLHNESFKENHEEKFKTWKQERKKEFLKKRHEQGECNKNINEQEFHDLFVRTLNFCFIYLLRL